MTENWGTRVACFFFLPVVVTNPPGHKLKSRHSNQNVGIYRDYTGIMQKKMETAIQGLGCSVIKSKMDIFIMIMDASWPLLSASIVRIVLEAFVRFEAPVVQTPICEDTHVNVLPEWRSV